MNSLNILVKRILSYLKKDWTLKDYPLYYREQSGVDDDCRWVAYLLNWFLVGVGGTKKEALEDLNRNFARYKKENNGHLPRPGARAPIKFADTARIDELEAEAADFFEKIIVDIDYYSCFISDQTSLYEFDLDEGETLKKINEVYGLDLEDLGDGNLADLLAVIKSRKGRSD